MARHKVRWPIARHLVPRPVFTGDHLADLFVAWDRSSTELYDGFEKDAALIDADLKLTELGKAEHRRAAVEQLRENPDVKRHQANVQKGRERIAQLMRELTAVEVPKDLSVFEQVTLAHQNDRMIRRFEAVPVAERHRVLRAAIEARDLTFLRSIHSEPGLLSEADARRVGALLLEGADPVKLKQLTEVAGQFDASGQHDPTTSAVAVAGFAVDALLEHADEWAGLDRVSEDARAKFGEQLKVQGAPLTMTSEEAHDPRIYRAAKALAQEHGRVLSIEGDQGSASIEPAASGNGAGQILSHSKGSADPISERAKMNIVGHAEKNT